MQPLGLGKIERVDRDTVAAQLFSSYPLALSESKDPAPGADGNIK